MPNPTWTFNPDGTIVNDAGTVKHFSEILTNHSTSYSTNRTLSSVDIFGTINLTGGSAYTLPTSAAIGDQITIVNTYSGDITLTFNDTSTTKISPGGITSFIYVDVNGWKVRSTSKNPVYNPAIDNTDPVTLLDMRNAMLANYATQSSITTITSLPATLNTANMSNIIVLNTASSGTLTLYDPRQTINNTYPATLIMNSGSGSVVISANAMNGSFTEQQNTLLTGQYMIVVGSSNGTFVVIDTNNRNPLTNGLLLESGVMNISGNTTLLAGHIGKTIVYGSSYSSGITITLPPATSVLNGHTAKFTIVNRSSGTVTLVCSGSDTITNNSNTLLPNTYKTVVSDASNTYMVISDNSDLAPKYGNINNAFSVASPTTGTQAVNANKLYSELTGIEGYNTANVTLTNTSKAYRVIKFYSGGAQTVVLPPLSSRNIAGGSLTLLLKAAMGTTVTVTTSTSDSFDPGYSNIIYPGEYMVLRYNPGDTGWQVIDGNSSHSSSASNIERILGTSAFFVSLFGSSNATALLNSIGGAPLASAALTGTPTTTTPAAGDNSTRIANTSFVSSVINLFRLTGIEGYNSATVTLTNNGQAYRVIKFYSGSAQTVVLPPLSSRNILGGALTLLLKTSMGTTVTVTTSGSDSFELGYSNIIYPGEYMVLRYNPGDTGWQVIDGNTGNVSSASNIARKLSLNYGLPQYDLPISYSYADNTVYYCPVPTRIIAVLSGDHKNNITMLVGSTNNPSYSVGSFGDDIDNNTKEASISADVPGGWYFKLTSSGNDAWETVAVTGYPIQRT